MLEGILVDLVPFNKTFRDLEHRWRNSEAGYWSRGGEYLIVTKRQVEADFREWAEERERGHAGVPFGIQTKDGTPIGMMGINWLLPHHRLGMLGARIGEREYWGGGYGTDALLLLCEYAFNWLDLHKVWLATSTMNARVIRQMEKVGFSLEGTVRDSNFADGKWYGAPIYGLLQEEWPGYAAMLDRVGLRAKLSS